MYSKLSYAIKETQIKFQDHYRKKPDYISNNTQRVLKCISKSKKASVFFFKFQVLQLLVWFDNGFLLL